MSSIVLNREAAADLNRLETVAASRLNVILNPVSVG